MADVITLPGASLPAVAPMLAPSLLAMLKDDLGIPADDTTYDAWLTRRADNIWRRFETYTGRTLATPPASFVDDWSKVSQVQAWDNLPPVLAFPPVGSVFLRVTPVMAVTALELHGQTADSVKVLFEPASGKLFSLTDAQYGHDVSQELRQGHARITYTAGWSDCPGDLYEALLGALQPLWGQKQAASAGLSGLGGTVTSVNVTDVGSVEVSAGNMYVDAANRSRSPGGPDPMLGPWVNILDSYRDLRVQTGSPLIPVTTPAVVTP
jgi:hypothetical protein